MDEEAQELVKKAGEKVLAYLESTEGFVAEQAPMLAQEIVRYGIWSNGIVAFTTLGIVVAYILVTRKFIPRAMQMVKDEKEEEIIPFVLMLGFMVFGGIASSFLLYNGIGSMNLAMKAIIAPRYYLLEVIGNIVN